MAKCHLKSWVTTCLALNCGIPSDDLLYLKESAVTSVGKQGRVMGKGVVGITAVKGTGELDI